jgi:hypothetical protein
MSKKRHKLHLLLNDPNHASWYIFWYLHVGASTQYIKVPVNVWFCIFVKVPNSNRISCCNSFLLECSPKVQEVVVSNHGRDMSRVLYSIVEDGDDLGQVSPYFVQ